MLGYTQLEDVKADQNIIHYRDDDRRNIGIGQLLIPIDCGENDPNNYSPLDLCPVCVSCSPREWFSCNPCECKCCHTIGKYHEEHYKLDEFKKNLMEFLVKEVKEEKNSEMTFAEYIINRQETINQIYTPFKNKSSNMEYKEIFLPYLDIHTEQYTQCKYLERYMKSKGHILSRYNFMLDINGKSEILHMLFRNYFGCDYNTIFNNNNDAKYLFTIKGAPDQLMYFDYLQNKFINCRPVKKHDKKEKGDKKYDEKEEDEKKKQDEKKRYEDIEKEINESGGKNYTNECGFYFNPILTDRIDVDGSKMEKLINISSKLLKSERKHLESSIFIWECLNDIKYPINIWIRYLPILNLPNFDAGISNKIRKHRIRAKVCWILFLLFIIICMVVGALIAFVNGIKN